jgi:hypothetical protein
MRTDPAAERLFVHPNTVRYRLRRYEELTGVDLRETEDAFRVWWALHREELMAPDAGDDGMPAPEAYGNVPASASAPPAPA